MRLFLLAPTVVFKARINQAGFTFPVSELTFDGVTTGAYTDIVEGMTVVLGTTDGGSDLGRQRIRKAATSDTIYLGRSSQGIRDGEIKPEDDAYITVWDDYRPWAKIPYITLVGDIYKDDDVSVGTKTDDIPPKANIEPPHAAGNISSGGSVLTVSFSGTGSYALSGTISSYLWDVDDGTITVGTAASSAITATFPAGFRWVSLTVTDSNANTHTMRIPVYARNPASDTTIQGFQLERQRITPQGQEVSLRILSSIPEATYPDGTLVMLWDEDLDTITTADHMQFVGWHHTDPAEISAERTAILSEVSLECLDMAGKLRTLPGFPISVESNDTPSSWLEMSSPNMDKYIDYILRWHSTALELSYVTMSGTGSNYPFVVLSSDAQSLWEQAARRAQSLVPDYVLTCDRKGRIAIKPDPMIQSVADRTATVQTTIDESEWSNISYTRQRQPRVHWLRSEAVLASADTIAAMFSIAPDDTPGQGISSRTQGEQLSRNQADLNASAGNRYARLNAFESPFSIQLASGNDYDMEPANMTWVRLTMGANYAAQRGLNFTDERGLIQEINITRRYGRTGEIRDISLTWERETDGPPAKAYIPPTTGIDDDIPYEPIPDPGFNPDPSPTAGTGFGKLYVMSNETLGRTTDFSAVSPSYAEIAAAVSGTYEDFILDPWAPDTTGYLLTSAGLYKSTDLDQASPSWSALQTAAQINTATSETLSAPTRVECSVNVEGYIALFFQTNSNNHMWFAYSENGGTTWTYVYVADLGSRTERCAGAVVQRLIDGDIRIYYMDTAGKMRRSDDRGDNWSNVGTPAGNPVTVHPPYDDNIDGDIVYVSVRTGGTDKVRISTNAGVSWTEVADLEEVNTNRYSVETATQNRQYMYIVERTSGADDVLYISQDGFSNSSAAPMSGINESNFSILATGGFPYNKSLFYLVTNGGIYVSVDLGQTWTDKTNDWASSFSGNNSVIVPLWTE